jgi:hypothetical protein
MAIDSGLGSDTANSYISATQADTFFADTFNNARWSAVSTANKEIGLITATAALQTLNWNGTQCTPSTTDASKAQSLSWPRSGKTVRGIKWACAAMPLPIIEATAMLALELAEDPTAITGTGAKDNPTGAVQSQELGALKQSFYDIKSNTGNSTKVSPGAPLVLQRFPFLIDLLNGYFVDATTSAGRIVTRVLS